ncbi:MAG: helix-turn-helix domain-containing protein, partial [Desulfobacterales bacterium]
RHFMKQISQEAALIDFKIDPKAEQALLQYHWPGNARELLNVLERTMASMEADTIYLNDLPIYITRTQVNFAENSHSPLKEVHRIAEKDAIELALKQSDYNKARAAKILGINRSLLYKKMAKHHISLHPD